MAKVSIVNVEVLDAEASFNSPYRFRITFDANEELPEDLEWKVTYVGCAESNDYDQVLDSVLVGPVPCGRHVFVFDAPAPDPAKIPAGELVGVTVVLLTCAYREQEFVRIGYFVRIEYDDPEMRENPPAQPVFEHLLRVILADSPRVTRLTISWNGDTVTNEATDLGTDVPSTSGAADNETTAAGQDEAASSSATANASDAASGDTAKAPTPKTNGNDSPSQNGDTDAQSKPKNGSTEQSNGTEKHSSCSLPVGNGESETNEQIKTNAEDEDEVARKRAKMDEANANGITSSVTTATSN